MWFSGLPTVSSIIKTMLQLPGKQSPVVVHCVLVLPCCQLYNTLTFKSIHFKLCQDFVIRFDLSESKKACIFKHRFDEYVSLGTCFKVVAVYFWSPVPGIYRVVRVSQLYLCYPHPLRSAMMWGPLPSPSCSPDLFWDSQIDTLHLVDEVNVFDLHC